MKKFLRLFSLVILLTLVTEMANAAVTFKYTVGATSTNPEYGLVCVKASTTTKSLLGGISHKDKPAPTSVDEYAASSEDVSETNYTWGSNGSEITQRFILYAISLDDNYVFEGWYSDAACKNKKSSDIKYIYEVKHSTTVENSGGGGGRDNFYAKFKPVSDVLTETNIPSSAAFISLDPISPVVGNTVKATQKIASLSNSSTDLNINMMIEFDHWEDNLGNVSYDEEYTFEVKEPMTLKAIYKNKGEVPQKGKYYRVRNIYNRVLTIEGSYAINVSGVVNLDPRLLRWALPKDHNYDDFHTGASNNEWEGSDKDAIWVEASPNTIYFVEDGKTDGTKLTNGVLSAQGANTKNIMNHAFDVVPMSDKFYGYYGVVATEAQGISFKIAMSETEEKSAVLQISTFSQSNANCAMAIQPIDEDHIEDFWFGAYADKQMYHDGGYWTSMYTAFPYQLYDEGVEAYYVKETAKANGQQYVCLTKIEDGYVPAESAVLLKCKEAENTKANRLLPLDPNDVNVKGKTLEGNLLKGLYQLYESNPEGRYTETREKNSETIRVFGYNSDKGVGFFRWEGTDFLKANKAFIDIKDLPQEVSALSFILGTPDMSGIESVVADGESSNFEADKVYDLGGREVIRPAAGNIYIMNGKKVLWK